MYRKFSKLAQLGLLFSLLSTAGLSVADQSLDSIVAIVNGSVITQSQFDQQKSLILAQLQQSSTPTPAPAALHKQILDNMIDLELGLQQAKAQKVTVSDAQVTQTLTNIAQQNNMSVTQLQAAVAQQGLDWGLYRDQIKNQMIINEVEQSQIVNSISVTDADVQAYLSTHGKQMDEVTQYHLQGILVPLAKTASATDVLKAQRQAETIAASLEAGENFNTTAVDESTGQKLQGGDMGWRTLAQMPPQLANMVAAAKPGTVFGPLQSANGYYIFKFVATQTVPMQHYTPSFQVRTILLVPNHYTGTDNTQALMQKIQTDLAQGTSFAALAKQYSQAPDRDNLTWISANELDPLVANAVAQLKPGQVSPPLQTSRGIEFFQLNAVKQTNDTHAYLVAQAKQAIYQQKFMAAAKQWLATLRKQAYIQIMANG